MIRIFHLKDNYFFKYIYRRKYYVYAGYYENFISGHKLPKPYTLRDEFKTFDEALDYVLENWEDDAIFFTEDVIGDAIDNGFINDEDWENYLMEESKNSTRKSIKESRGQTVAELLQNASSKTIVHIYNDSTSDEFVGTNDQLKGEFSRFLYYTVSVWNIGNDKIVNIYCY